MKLIRLTACCVALAAAPVAAETPPDRPPVAINILKPDAGGTREGWLELSLSVNSTGKVSDIRIGDGFYALSQSADIITAVKTWRFAPGRVNGQHINWDNLRFDIFLALRKTKAGVLPDFSHALEGANAALDKGDYTGAKTAIDDIIGHKVTLLYEYALAEESLYFAETGLGHPQAALTAIGRATKGGSEPETMVLIFGSLPSSTPEPPLAAFAPADYLSPEQLKGDLQNRFLSEAQLGRYLEALETSERINKLGALPADDPISKDVDNIRRVLASDKPLSIKLQLEDGSWSLRAPRRDLKIQNVTGRVSDVSAECDRHRGSLPYQADTVMTLPPEWGECQLIFAGDPGTTFTLLALSPTPTAPAASAPAQ